MKSETGEETGETGGGSLTIESSLRIISRAWGRQRGYAFFPTIRGDAKDKAERIQSYREGKAYKWPGDKEEIIIHLKANWENEVYWCPNLFEYPRRRTDFAMDEMALWADLDEIDPRTIDDYPPTIAWETSPGRYQALWLSAGDSFLGVSWAGRENQRLSMHLGADPSGWDTTQLLRIPGWINHKPEYRERYGGEGWRGRLVWSDWANRVRYDLEDFEGLPETGMTSWESLVVEEMLSTIDSKKLWSEVRLRLPVRTRQLYKQTRLPAGMDRSELMWSIERDMADAGLGVHEIVALMKDCPWNKFSGRQDEFQRLGVEANKAVAMRTEQRKDAGKGGAGADADEQVRMDKIEFEPFEYLFANLKKPQWIVKDIWTEGACGFIAGQPKLHKSWIAFDLALSIATGRDFLDTWKVMTPGPVAYVQEEDNLAELKRRFSIMWPSKQNDRIVKDDAGDLWWEPAADMTTPDVSALVGKGLVLSDPTWQEWLDEQLTRGRNGVPYRMLVLDPLLMMLGDVDDNKAPVMNEQVFKPLKQLAVKHGVAVCVVHHMRKGVMEGRGGQMMLGSVANHAWAQDAMYLAYGRGGVIDVERESKSSPYLKFKLKDVTQQANAWGPRVTNVRGLWDEDGDDEDEKPKGRPSRSSVRMTTVTIREALRSSGEAGLTTNEIVDRSGGLARSGIIRRLKSMQSQGLVKRASGRWVATLALLP